MISSITSQNKHVSSGPPFQMPVKYDVDINLSPPINYKYIIHYRAPLKTLFDRSECLLSIEKTYKTYLLQIFITVKNCTNFYYDLWLCLLFFTFFLCGPHSERGNHVYMFYVFIFLSIFLFLVLVHRKQAHRLGDCLI